MADHHFHLDEGAHGISIRLGISAGLTVCLVAAEVVAGLLANSLALLTDAAHNATDVVALVLSWYAVRLAQRPAHSGKTYGYHRAGILAALVNSTTLVVVALGVFYEAYRRVISPPEVRAGILISVAVVAFGINLATALLIRRGSEHDLSLRSVFVHLMGDVFSTLGAAVAGVAIAWSGWNGWDALAGVLIGVLILWNAWGILRETIHILLESTPEDIDPERMVRDMLAVDGVRGVHDLHIWSITREMRTLSAHILVGEMTVRDSAALQIAVGTLLCDKYGIQHSTLQMECDGCLPNTLYCDMAANANNSSGHREKTGDG
jgi:cobalt-zinc-cadmium efflux system protein